MKAARLGREILRKQHRGNAAANELAGSLEHGLPPIPVEAGIVNISDQAGKFFCFEHQTSPGSAQRAGPHLPKKSPEA